MKKQIILTSFALLLMSMTLKLYAQVGINSDGSQPDLSAMLDVKSAEKGFLPPRVALTALDVASPVISPAVGLLVYNLSSSGMAPNKVMPGYYYWNGQQWISITPPHGTTPGDMLNWNGTSWEIIPAGTYGQQLVFCNGVPSWGGCPPMVTSGNISTVTPSYVLTGGTVQADGGSFVAARGVAWGISENPSLQDNITTDGSGTGPFVSTITGFSPNTLYHVRAYATNCKGTVYGNDLNFTSPDTCTNYVNAGVSIYTSTNNVCAASSVTFTATPTNGGNNPVYQWKVNGTNTGTNSTTYNYIPANGDIITCVMISGLICVTGNPATSDPITMTVTQNLPVTVSISASANPVCTGTTVDFTATPTNGGPNPIYQWKVNGINLGSNSSTYSYIPANNDIIACTLTSDLSCVSGSPATSNSIQLIANPILPVAVNIAASSNPVELGNPVTYTATPVNGGTAPVFQWKVNGINVGTSSLTYDYVPANGDVVTCVLTSNLSCKSGNPATSNAITMVVNQTIPVSVSIVASANPVCSGISVTFTATPVNGGPTPAYQWKINGSNMTGASNATYTNNPVNNDIVTCVLTSSDPLALGVTATSNALTMTVNSSLAVSVSISPSANPVCTGTQVTITATPTNGGSAPAYQWKVNGTTVTGVTNATYSYTPANNDAITCTLTSNIQCATGNPAISNTVNLTLGSPVQAGISIAASLNPFCTGNPVTFTATPTNGGTNPSFQWKVNGTNMGTNSSTYTYNPANNDVVSCVMTSDLSCVSGNPATSNAITMTGNSSMPVSVTIAASVYAVMPGTQVTFTATPLNGGSSPTYQWKVNNTIVGPNSNTYTYTPANSDKITCVLTSSLSSCVSGNPATSNQIILIVYNTGTPCPGVPTVSYSGLTYNTVLIDTQCWLRENLNLGTRINGSQEQTNNGILEKYCYGDNEANCNVYGGLYQWGEMVQYLNGGNNTTNWNPVPTGNVQGLCPAGWHIPTNAEYGNLMTYLGGQGVTGGQIKEAGTSHFNYPNTSATNSTGFTALPGGERWNNGLFYFINKDAIFWTTTSCDPPSNPATDVYYDGAQYSIQPATMGQLAKSTGVSVRCLKD